jgi:hypothetical protein
MDNDIFKIEDDLYSDKSGSEAIVTETKTILKEIDEELVDKVVRIKIKGQIDGN